MKKINLKGYLYIDLYCNYFSKLNGALTNYQKTYIQDVSGTDVINFIENLSVWIRDNIEGAFDLKGSWVGQWHYTAYGVRNYDDLNFTVTVNNRTFTCFYQYGINRTINEVATKSDLSIFPKRIEYRIFNNEEVAYHIDENSQYLIINSTNYNSYLNLVVSAWGGVVAVNSIGTTDPSITYRSEPNTLIMNISGIHIITILKIM